MFGIIYTLFHAFSFGADKLNKTFIDSKNRERSNNIGDLTYSGRNGGTYLTENGRQVYCAIDRISGHEVIKDFKTGKVYYDLTNIKLKKRIEEVEKKGDTVYFPFNKDQEIMAHKQRVRTGIYNATYIDIETGHYVSTKYINGYPFYIDLYNGKLLRLTDGYIKNSKGRDPNILTGNLTPDEIINFFNQRQEKLKQNSKYQYGGDNEWTKEVFYICNHFYIYMTKEGRLVANVHPDDIRFGIHLLQPSYRHMYDDDFIIE